MTQHQFVPADGDRGGHGCRGWWDDCTPPTAAPGADLVVGGPVALDGVKESRADVAVTEALADGLHRHPGVDQFGGVGVAQLV
jgi:hypothetical protein